MALLYRVELRPTKLELLTAWLPGRAWFSGTADGLATIASFRFDDPEGEVGVETLLVRAGDDGTLFQVPLTYRGAALDDGRSHLIGTLEHPVLGTRWVYDAAGDPVYLQTLVTAAVNGGSEAELLVDTDGATVTREPTLTVSGSGTGHATFAAWAASAVLVHDESAVTIADVDGARIAIARTPGEGPSPAAALGDGAETLTGTWEGRTEQLAAAVLLP